MEIINLAIVEDEKVVRESLVTFFSENRLINISFVAESIEQFLSQLKEAVVLDVNLILLDIGLPGLSGIQGIYHIRKYLPEADIVMLTTFEQDENIFDALCAGACSYISKRTSLVQIQEALYVVHRGGSYMSPSIARKIANKFRPDRQTKTAQLTERQRQIVDALVDGLSYKLIAAKLGVSLDTVRDHIKKIYRALNVNSKAEVIKRSIDGKL